MEINQQLKPYYKRIYLAYGIRVAVLTILGVLWGLLFLLIWSKVTVCVGLNRFLLAYSIMTVSIGVIVGVLKKPSKDRMVRDIDGLGFENRVATYMEYRGGDNPFNDFLEKELSEVLKGNTYHKSIPIKPPSRWMALGVCSLVALGGMTFWQPEPWVKGRSIDASIEGIQKEEEVLLEALEDLPLTQEGALDKDDITERLQAIKEAMAMENQALVEEELFKMEEALKEGLSLSESSTSSAKQLPAELSKSLETIGDLALTEGQATLLSTLQQEPSDVGHDTESGTQELGDNSNASEEVASKGANGNGEPSSTNDGT